MLTSAATRLIDLDPDLERILTFGADDGASGQTTDIKRETVWVSMRDGVRLATDLYFPSQLPAPTVVMRTPYGRASEKLAAARLAFARHGYVVMSQDCRGTGDSEPDSWDYYMYESDDGYDTVEWLQKQRWFNGFAGGCGGSYVGQTQWCMALHTAMSTIAPEVSGLGIAVNTVRLHMFCNAYARSVGKGAARIATHYSELERQLLPETLAGGYFNDPVDAPLPAGVLARFPALRELSPAQARSRLWELYCALSCEQRTEFVKQALHTSAVTITEVELLSTLFGPAVSHDAHSIPHPDPAQLCRLLHAPALMITGWYDWGLNDALATWEVLRREAREPVRSRSRLIITPSAHSMPGYHEGAAERTELQRAFRLENNVAVLLRWYDAVRRGTTDEWPTVIYYLMGANEWRAAQEWPLPHARPLRLYLGPEGSLATAEPREQCASDRYLYDPQDPTPTIGGSILSYVYRPGSVDVSEVQKRPDVLTYSTPPLERDLDVVGPLRLYLYASSSALDTDFSARISDVFPNGRVIQLQSGVLRARYRDLRHGPRLLRPGHVYLFEVDLWATANRFKAGHRLRIDVHSADFPRFDRNSNRGGEPGLPIPALQSIYRDRDHPSHVVLSVLSDSSIGGTMSADS